MVDDLYEDCRICGKTFIKITSNQIYCSQPCREEAAEKKKKSPKNEACAECGCGFLWLPTKPTQKYCSGACLKKAASRSQKRKRYEEADALKADVERKVDLVLKQAAETKPAQFEGKLINFWDAGGFTEKIKEEVKERDNFRCRICDLVEGQLEVHHILKRLFGGGNDYYNLITLCTSCHRAVETGDETHTKRKCYRNALKVNPCSPGIINAKVTDKQRLSQLSFLLDKVFRVLSQENKGGEFTETLIEISDNLDN